MVTLVIGGSCSGKSEYAEQCLDHASGRKFYIATMIASDEESREKVRRHRERRRGRGFITIECGTGLEQAASRLPRDCFLLLEGIGTLAANELFSEDRAGACELREQERTGGARRRILDGIKALAARADELVIVSDEVNRAGCEYRGETRLYLRLVGELNQELSRLSDRVIEMVCGYAVPRKEPLKNTSG